MDYLALKDLLVSEGIADAIAPAQAAAQLNAQTLTVGVPLDPAALTRVLMDNGDLMKIQAVAADSGDPLHAAAAQAVALLRTARDYGMPLHMWPGTKDREAWDQTVQTGLIGAQSDADVGGAAETVVSPAQSVGLGHIDAQDVTVARSM